MPWAVAAGLPIFVIVMLIPLSLIGGLYAVFTSSAWTLAYRQVTRPTVPPAPEPEPILPPAPEPMPIVPEPEPLVPPVVPEADLLPVEPEPGSEPVE